MNFNPLEEAERIKDEIIAWRRDFHMHPELGFEEERTSKIVEEHLKEWGYKVKRIGTGIVAEIGEGERTVALRADMDALPIQEENDVPYKSKIPGKMHACGHDAHTAMLLGAAKIIANHADELSNKVRLIFQPAEEVGEGALKIIEGGGIDGVDAIFGIHVWAELESGVIGIREGPFLAGVGKFYAKVIGKGGHGAAPHLSIDPIPAVADIVLALQRIVAREVDPLENAVVTVGRINGGTAFNVIPQYVELEGTFRFFTEELGKFLESRIKEIIENVAKAHKCTTEVGTKILDPPTINDARMAEFVENVARSLNLRVGEVRKTLGGEDFAFYLQKVPGAFIALGIRNEKKGIVYPHHHPKFDVDEDVLHLGTALEVAIAFNFKG
ncbi:amino acid amidohydrolase [Pyrococcus sp. NA2]|uniref:M20 metallopeptidase family protein n=1 Tax=Pyrococcus sp. (strain NA2) TaxID=342949 RepID=UPI000209AE8C|nr:amidohydrolase [Pyrococcus sp. NA2]AEC52282.1 amino acid amidohydrolase [Pyrococcus sp. NA2]